MGNGLTDKAKATAARVAAVADLSIFQQPAAIRELLPDVVGLIVEMCQRVEQLERGANGG